MFQVCPCLVSWISKENRSYFLKCFRANLLINCWDFWSHCIFSRIVCTNRTTAWLIGFWRFTLWTDFTLRCSYCMRKGNEFLSLRTRWLVLLVNLILLSQHILKPLEKSNGCFFFVVVLPHNIMSYLFTLSYVSFWCFEAVRYFSWRKGLSQHSSSFINVLLTFCCLARLHPQVFILYKES